MPQPVRSYAQTQIAALAAGSDSGALAVEEARRLVRRRPVPAEHLTLLAIAQIKAGQAEQAGTTIQIAGQRGWRDPVAQEAVLRLALAAGDKPEAARRYAALFLRAATPNELLQEVGPAVLAETGGAGQRTLVDIISGTDRWNEAFLHRGAQVMTPATFTDIAAATIARGTRFDCAVMAQTIKVLGQRDAASAERLRAAAGGQCENVAG
ncbi:hypothetical protein [Erythrobacter sp. NFXS35]|uniref:hypothetical protein n=1 Tax=Erythrobacter sp. NFXS35 TaxID=2818436 RepID=UPI0032DF983A